MQTGFFFTLANSAKKMFADPSDLLSPNMAAQLFSWPIRIYFPNPCNWRANHNQVRTNHNIPLHHNSYKAFRIRIRLNAALPYRHFQRWRPAFLYLLRPILTSAHQFCARTHHHRHTFHLQKKLDFGFRYIIRYICNALPPRSVKFTNAVYTLHIRHRYRS